MHSLDANLSAAETYTKTLWAAKDQAPKEIVEKMMAEIQPLLDENAAIPNTAFIEHPLAQAGGY